MLNRHPSPPVAAPGAARAPAVGDEDAERAVSGPREADSRSVEVACEPDLAQVSSVREFVESYYRTIIHDGDVICRMAVAAHELLENAAKYSIGGLSRLQIEIRGGANPRLLSVSVSNHADPARIDELKLAIAELGSTANAAETYQKCMSRSTLRKDGSGLGLARIRAEAEMTLVLEFQGDQVCVKAVATPTPEEES